MGSSLSTMSDPGSLVADTSTVINLNASGRAAAVISALPHRIAVVDVVPGELANGRANGRRDADMFDDLVRAGIVDLVSLDGAGAQHFEELVVGPAAQTLDDGEAATIAYAAVIGAVAIIDERKALRICGERFPTLRTGCTVDLFAHPAVRKALGASALAEAVFNALHNGRMRVPPHHIAWVVGLIGRDRVGLCTSLPHAIRNAVPPVAAEG